MATNTVPTLESEPTADFNHQCVTLVQRWRAGQVPQPELLRSLDALANEATSTGHLANQARIAHINGYVHHYLGNLTTSMMHYERAHLLYKRVDNPLRMATMDLNNGENYRFKGEFKRARRLYRSAYDTATQHNDLKLQTMAIANEGLVLIPLKDYRNARAALIESLKLAQRWEAENDLPGLLCEVHQGLATIDLLEDDTESAWEHARKALGFAQQSNEMLDVGYAYRIVADVLTALNHAPEDGFDENPNDYYQRALAAFREVGAEAEIGRTIYAQAKSYARRGRRRNAAQLFREAMVVFTRLGMTDDAARAAEAQLRVL